MLSNVSEWIVSFAPYLSKLQPASNYILLFSALLLAVAVLGGGIHVKDVQIPPLGFWSRILASLASTMIFSLFILVTTAVDVQIIRPSGNIVFLDGHVPEGVLKLELRPVNPVAQTDVVMSGAGSNHTFKVATGVPAGTYDLVLQSPKGRLGSVVVKVENNKDISVLETPDHAYITSSQKEVVKDLIEKYRDERWQNQVTAIEILSAIAVRNEDVRQDLRKRLTSSRDKPERYLVAFSLSHICSLQDTESHAVMKSIWLSRENRENPFQQIRARASFRCVEAEKDEVQRDLLEIVKKRHEILKNKSEAQRDALAITAAYFVALMGTKRACVVETLIPALTNNVEMARTKAREGLLAISVETDSFARKAEWDQWWTSHRNEYEMCS